MLGASPKPDRYSNMAAYSLLQHNQPVLLVGMRKAVIADATIETEWPENESIDTITLYLSAKNQLPYYNKILGSGARRLIFNPGTENQELAQLAQDAGIHVEIACTLVLLGTNQY